MDLYLAYQIIVIKRQNEIAVGLWLAASQLIVNDQLNADKVQENYDVNLKAAHLLFVILCKSDKTGETTQRPARKKQSGLAPHGALFDVIATIFY